MDGMSLARPSLLQEGLFFQVYPTEGRKDAELDHVLRLAVYDKRSSWIRGDALVGEASLQIKEAACGQPIQETLTPRPRLLWLLKHLFACAG